MDYAHKAVTPGYLGDGRAGSPHLKRAEDGRVVTISTLNVHVHRPGFLSFPTSATAKARLEDLTRTLAIHLAPYGVCVNCRRARPDPERVGRT
jgi:NAD(P)-dependent dehydrogenase (short-subunit alcohol dehydrogenase family)